MRVVHEISVATGIPIGEVLSIIVSAPKRYRVYEIDKKGGGKREIAHPARELKIIQRFMLDNFLSKFPVHRSAAAYIKGKNIYENARYHADSNYILKLDFEKFFPSIKATDWRKFIEESDNSVFSIDDIEPTLQIFFWGCGSRTPKCLSIGAPTSPAISNMMLYQLDSNIYEKAKQFEVRYTRYADDITISGSSRENVLLFEKVLRTIISEMKSPKLKFNDGKRGLYGRGQRRLVTGLLLTPGGGVSLGRDRKRMIAALLHKLSLEALDVEKMGELKGWLGFSAANEPEFLNRMRRKYGDDLLDRALSFHVPSRAERKALLA